MAVNFCLEHAKSAGVFQAKGYGLVQEKEKKQQPLVLAGLACPHCNLTLNEFNRRGRLGCNHCYETFGDYIARILKHIRQGESHCGKVPACTHIPEVLQERIAELEIELQEAIKSEHYEEAAQVRDRITELMKQEKNFEA